MTDIVKIDPYIIDVLLPDLNGHDRRPAAFCVYLALWRRTGGGNRQTGMSLQSLADATGLSRSAVQSSLEWLRWRGLIATARANPTAVPRHTVLTPWRR